MAVVSAPLAIAFRLPVFSMCAAAVCAAGAYVCHQRPDRCFWIHGRPMPVCARCSGLYAGAAVAAPLALVCASALSRRRARLLAAIAALPTAITWGIEIAGLAHSSNIIRAPPPLPPGFPAASIAFTPLPYPPPLAPTPI